jgi:hypothetical protein
MILKSRDYYPGSSVPQKNELSNKSLLVKNSNFIL